MTIIRTNFRKLYGYNCRQTEKMRNRCESTALFLIPGPGSYSQCTPGDFWISGFQV